MCPWPNVILFHREFRWRLGDELRRRVRGLYLSVPRSLVLPDGEVWTEGLEGRRLRLNLLVIRVTLSAALLRRTVCGMVALVVETVAAVDRTVVTIRSTDGTIRCLEAGTILVAKIQSLEAGTTPLRI